MTENTADARFTRLYSEYYDEVLAYCTRRIGRREADDATADVFVTVWRRLDEVRWETARPWLYSIARSVIGNRWRSLRRRQRLLSRVTGLGQTGPEIADALGISVAAAEQRLHRAKRRFARTLARTESAAGFSPRAATEQEGGGR